MDQTLTRALDRWHRASLLSDEQVADIRAYEDARPPDGDRETDQALRDAEGDGRSSVLAEGLAYLGAALAFGAGVAVFGELWSDLSAGGRVALAAMATAIVAAASWALKDQRGASGRRLSTVLAALSVVGVGLTVGIALEELTSLPGEWIPVVAGIGALTVGVPVHLARETWPTTLALGGAVLLTVIGVADVLGLLDGALPAGVMLMGLGLAWAAAGWSGLARPRSAFEVTGLLAGGVGVQVIAFEDLTVVALVIGLLVAGGALAVGLTEERTAPAVLGGLGITVYAPQLVFEVFGETVGGPLALFVGGVTLVGVSVMILRQKDVV